MKAARCGGFTIASVPRADRGSADASQGNASVVPQPRKNRRRDWISATALERFISGNFARQEILERQNAKLRLTYLILTETAKEGIAAS